MKIPNSKIGLVIGKGDTMCKTSVEKSITSLEAMGVRIYGLNEPNFGYWKYVISWDNIVGYN